MIANLRAEIWTRELQNKEQEFYPLDLKVQPEDVQEWCINKITLSNQVYISVY
jgi:hypothetical protein